ncbi:MAG: response regulator [Myxococcales bacterium]|nr:response regulator [Myxococcales bacterium]
MPKTLLAVDDSVTMRKVIEMTFAGEDVRVVTVGTSQDALNSIRQSSPDAVIADVALDGASGYDLCKSIKDQFRGVPVILLSSKQNPYDAARGQAAGADAQIDKPWDTTKAIDLVKKVFAQGQSVAPAPIAAAPVVAAAPAPKPMFAAPAAAAPVVAPVVAMPPREAPASTVHGMPAVGRPPPPRAPAPSPVAPPVAASPALQKSITVDVSVPRAAVPAPTPTPPPVAPVAAPQPAPSAAAGAQVQHGTLAELAQHAPAPATGAGIGPELERKLEGLGLTPAQVDAVVALSREVVEKVVWEVVPILAETLIKEEIARLTKE